MHKDDLITISYIIPAYNCGAYIENALLGMLSKIDENDEIVIINDSSSDDTLAAISNVDDQRLKIHSFESNKGVSAARNKGLELSTKDYVTFVDADDALDDAYFDSIKKYVHEYNRPDVVRFTAKGNTFNLTSDVLEIHDFSGFEPFYENSFVLHSVWGQLLSRPFLAKHRIVFDESLSFGEDLLFSFSVYQRIENAIILDKGYYLYSLTEGSISNTLDSDKILRRIFDITNVYAHIISALNDPELRTTMRIKHAREISNQTLKLFATNKSVYRSQQSQIEAKFVAFGTGLIPEESVYDRYFNAVVSKKNVKTKLLGSAYTLISKVRR